MRCGRRESIGLLGMALFALAGCGTRGSGERGAAGWNGGPWTQIALAPDGKSLVFIGKENVGNSKGDLYRLDLQTGTVAQLTNSAAEWKGEPRFSHDGTQITYLGSQANGTEAGIFVLSLADKRTRLITDPKQTALDFYKPAFSFDDSQILVGARHYSGLGPDGYLGGICNLFLIPIAGGGKPVPVMTDKFEGYIHGLFYDKHMILFQREGWKRSPEDISKAGSTVTAKTLDSHMKEWIENEETHSITVELLDTRTGKRTPLPKPSQNTFLQDVEPGGTRILIHNAATDETPRHTFVADDIGASFEPSAPLLDETHASLLAPSLDGKETVVHYLDYRFTLFRVPLKGGTPELLADSRLFLDPLKWRPKDWGSAARSDFQ